MSAPSCAASSTPSVPPGWCLVPSGQAALPEPTVSFLGPPPATSEQLRSLTHLPAALLAVSASSRGGRSKKGQKKGVRSTIKTVGDGKIVSRAYATAGSRPLRALGSLEQGLTVTLDWLTNMFTSSATVPVYQGLSFQLNNFSKSTSYSSLFDQYRFEQIEIWIEPTNPTITVADVLWASAIDLDDANTPTTVDMVVSRQGSITSNSLTSHYHKWRPHVAIAEYSGAFTSFGNAPAGWIDVASPSVQHYGLKIATYGADGVARPFVATVRAVVSFRAPGI